MAEQSDPATSDFDTANAGTTQHDAAIDAGSPPKSLTDLIDDLGREAFSRYLDHAHPHEGSASGKS